MRWPWSRIKPSGGAQARKQADANLAEAHSNWPEVKRVSRSLRELREHNHFADQLGFIMRGGDDRDR